MEQQNVEQQVTRGLGAQPSFDQRNYPFPTEVINLPSKGLCYPETSPLSKGEVVVKLLTAKEEDILTSSNLIKKGIVLDKLLESILVDSNININDLLIGDKNAILVSSRVLAYGAEYTVNVTDPIEKETVEVTIDMGKLNIKEIDESKLNRNNEYELTLPKSGAKIKFKLLTHGDEVAIQKDIDAAEKTLKQSNEVTARYRRVITEVNGNKDVGFISNFVINQFQAQDARELRKYMATITPDVDFTFEYISPFTGEGEALKVPIGADFFYPAD